MSRQTEHLQTPRTLSQEADTAVFAPADSVELTPVDSIELTSADSVELTPVDSIELTSADSVELAPVDSVELTPADSVELAPVDSVELTPVDSVASASEESVPASFQEGREWVFGRETYAPAAFADPFRKARSDGEVFGSSVRTSFTVPSGAPPEEGFRPGHNEWILDGLVFLTFFLYLTLLFRHRNSIFLLFRSLTIPGQFGQLIEEQNVSFRIFVWNARMLGFLTLLAIALKGSLIWAGMPDSSFPQHLVPYLMPLLVFSLLAVLCYKRVANGVISLLSRQKDKVENIRTFNRLFFAASALIFTPIALICTLSVPAWNGPFFTIQSIILIVLCLYYVSKSFSFFVSRKIPILQWILYLCAVEIWPVSFFVLFAGRGFEW